MESEQSDREAAEAADNALLVEIHALAHRLAGRHATRRNLAEDIAQDVVTHCLIRMREGRWNLHGRSLDSHISCLVRRRAFDLRRRSRVRAERDFKHLQELERHVGAWTGPDLSVEERDMALLENETLATLAPAYRAAYLLVKDAGASYAQAAEQLGLSIHTVKKYVLRGNRLFRRALRARGIAVPLEQGVTELPPAASEPREVPATEAESSEALADYQDYVRMKGAIAYLRQELARREREESEQGDADHLEGPTDVKNGRTASPEERRALARAAAYFRNELARREQEEQGGGAETAEPLLVG
jgi:RNA polymerase sigma factor (sigma-70 family)